MAFGQGREDSYAQAMTRPVWNLSRVGGRGEWRPQRTASAARSGAAAPATCHCAVVQRSHLPAIKGEPGAPRLHPPQPT